MWRFHRLISIDNFRYFTGWTDTETQRPHSFGKRTVIYGPNGSGKSTLADIFCAIEYAQAPESPTDPRLNSIRFALTDGDSIKEAKGTGPEVPRVLVFGRQYVERNLRQAFEGPDAVGAPLYVVGERDVDLDQKIAETQKILGSASDTLDAAKQTQREAMRVQTPAIDRVKDDVQDLLGAYDPGKYNRTRFNKNRVEELFARFPMGDPLGPDAHQACLDDLRKSPESVRSDIIPLRAPESTVVAQRLETLAELSVVSRSIDGLMENRKLADWVQAGLAFHSRGDDCAFCASPVGPARLDELNAHFDDSYRLLQDELTTARRDLQALVQAFEVAEADVNRLAERPGSTGEWVTAQNQSFSDYFQAVRDWIQAAEDFFRRREESPFTPVAWVPPSLPDPGIWQELATTAGEENMHLQHERTNVSTLREDAAERLLAHVAARHRDEYAATKAAIQVAEGQLAKASERCEELIEQLQDLKSGLREGLDGHRLAAELSAELQRYLGPRQLTVTFVREEDRAGFVFLRDGQPAQHLSEGERGAIALLHFLRSLDSADNEPQLASTCVVFDDPVSSFDNEAMTAAFGFLSLRMQLSATDTKLRCAQLVVLTHNFHFYHLWRDALDRAANRDKNDAQASSIHELKNRRVALLELRVTLNRGESRRSSLRELGHSRLGRSEYHLLFDYISRAVSGDDNDDTALLAGNAARRLVESFVRWRLPQELNLAASIRELSDQKGIQNDVLTRVDRALTATSHRTELDMATGQYVGDVVEDLRATLAFMKRVDPEHFGGMCKAIQMEPNLGAFADV